jgi:AmmeMemoRadiSam system protein B
MNARMGRVGLLLAICMIQATACGRGGEEGAMAAKPERVVRKAMGAGRWFPGDGKPLKAAVDGFMKAAELPAIEGTIVGAISPHAGYQYSGAVAGYTFRALRDAARGGGGPQTAVVLGFSHRGGFPGVALMDGDAIETPLGETPLDRESGDFLVAGSGRIGYRYSLHGGEHSAENQIPFVQAALPGVPLVVALIGDHDPATIRALADLLVALSRKKRIVVIASTDLLHDPDYERVKTTDATTVKQIAGLDAEGLLKRWSYEQQVCCGLAPVATVMRFAQALGCKQGVTLRYRNSGDDYPESRGQWVVGYGSVVFPVSK